MRALLTLGLGILVLAGAAVGGDNKEDTAKMQGTWVAPHDGKKAVLKIEKDAYTFTLAPAKDKEMVFKGTFKIDASKKPKTMDLKVAEGEKYKGDTALAIYEFKDGTLRWCSSEPGNTTRPKEFAAKDGEKHQMNLVFKMEKAK